MVAIDSTERYLSTIVSVKETKVICSSVLHFQRWKDFTMVTDLTLHFRQIKSCLSFDHRLEDPVFCKSHRMISSMKIQKYERDRSVN